MKSTLVAALAVCALAGCASATPLPHPKPPVSGLPQGALPGLRQPGGPGSTTPSPPPWVPPADPALAAAENKAAAIAAVRKLIAEMPLPPGSVRDTSKEPDGIGGGGFLATSTDAVDLYQLWRVPLPFTAITSWVPAHAPSGLKLSNWGGGGGPGQGYSKYYSYIERTTEPPFPDPPGLAVSALAAGSTSIWKVEGEADYLDPAVLRDTDTGPRIRLEVGGSCPASLGNARDVTNTAPLLDRYLLPPGTVTNALVCEYGGYSTKGKLSATLRPSGMSLSQLVADARSLRPLVSFDGSRSCTLDPGGEDILAFQFDTPKPETVDLWLHPGGCPGAGNGEIVADNQSLKLPS